MSGHTPSVMRLEQRAAEADHIIDYLKQQVQLLKEKASKRHKNRAHTHTQANIEMHAHTQSQAEYGVKCIPQVVEILF